MKFEDIKFKDFIPSFEEMIAVVYEALSSDNNFVIFPWKEGEKPSIEEVALVYKNEDLPLIQIYIPACILLGKEVPKKYRDAIERRLNPEAFFKRLDDTEKLLKMTFELFISTNPSLEEAVERLIQLSGDYWQEALDPQLAEKQIKEMYPDQVWRGKIIV
jgi:hypothetical protein